MTSIAKQAGCRPPWDSWSPASLSICDSLEELLSYYELEEFIKCSEKKLMKKN